MKPGSPWWRRTVHGAAIAAGWLLFAWCWQRVTAGRPEAGELPVLVFAALIVVPVLTLSWVLHNVGIHRRKGPRRAVTPVTWSYEADFNGRKPLADWTALQHVRRIDVTIEGDVKRFAGVPVLPTANELAESEPS